MISEGRVVDISDYVKDEKTDFSNKYTDIGESISDAITKLFTDGISGAWDAIKVLFF